MTRAEIISGWRSWLLHGASHHATRALFRGAKAVGLLKDGDFAAAIEEMLWCAWHTVRFELARAGLQALVVALPSPGDDPADKLSWDEAAGFVVELGVP